MALVDKAGFPRDKACGDLIGPRGVQTLAELGIHPKGPHLGDMEVIGPTGRRVVLPAREGLSYPGHAIVAPRLRFDAFLHHAAVEAGAIPFTGRAGAPLYSSDGRLEGFDVHLDRGDLDDDRLARLTADVVIGADGALSRVGAAAGLVDDKGAIWGFALRGYIAAAVALPRIYFWEPSRWSGYPGYGWVFPGEDGAANVGIGVAARGDRRIGARAVRDLPRFLAGAGFDPSALTPTVGGWLKMGMVGTVPASGTTLLVGDAAGLVNSLQGEGIAQALGSGRAAAEAVLKGGPARASSLYLEELAARYAPHALTTGPATAWMIERPRVVAAIGRLLTAPGIGHALAGGWAIYWNDLLEGASPGWPRRVAQLAHRMGSLATSRAADRRGLTESLSLTEPAAGGESR